MVVLGAVKIRPRSLPTESEANYKTAKKPAFPWEILMSTFSYINRTQLMVLVVKLQNSVHFINAYIKKYVLWVFYLRGTV